LGLHAVLLLAVAFLPREKRAAPPPPKVLQVELREVARPKGPPQVEPGPAPATPTPTRKVKEAKPDLPPVPPTAPAPPTPGAPAQDATADRWREWHAAGIDRSGGHLSLQLEHPESALPPVGDRGDDSSGLVREKSREEKLAEEQSTVKRRIDGWFSDEKAKQRAQTNRDAYWQAVEDRLRHGFDPGSDILDQGPKARSRLGEFLDSWQQQAASYGRTGNPSAGVPDAPGAARPLNQEFTKLANEDRGLGGGSFSTLPPLFNLLGAGGTTNGQPGPGSLVTLVRITLREDGSLFAVELAGSSGNGAYDRLVLGKARSLDMLKSGARPPALVTLWAFETNVTQAPPLPIAGCALDDFVPKNCWAPLQKQVRSRVRLMAIF
jgi:hypothetical protein